MLLFLFIFLGEYFLVSQVNIATIKGKKERFRFKEKSKGREKVFIQKKNFFIYLCLISVELKTNDSLRELQNQIERLKREHEKAIQEREESSKQDMLQASEKHRKEIEKIKLRHDTVLREYQSQLEREKSHVSGLRGLILD